MKLFISILFVLLLSVSNVFSQWVKINSGLTDYLFSAFFLDSQTGFTGGQSASDGFGKIYKTTNGAATWNLCFATSSGNERFESLFFINQQTGWAGSYYNMVYKTTNSGVNWSPYYGYGRIRKIFFINSETGWLAGSHGSMKTTNGGLNWFYTLGNTAAYGIHFFDHLTGVVTATAGSSSDIYRTTNGGTNWLVVYNEPDGTIINTFSFLNENTGFATGGYKATFKTTNKGLNWVRLSKDPMSSVQFSDLRGLKFIDANLGYACGQYVIPGPSTQYGTVFNKTTNGGISWQNVTVTPYPSYAFEDIQIPDGQNGFLFGSSGQVYKSTNAGFVSINSISTEIPKFYSLHQNYPNPFNPSTKIKFEIPLNAVNTRWGVSLRIYDILGREVRTLVNENLRPGVYEADFNAADLPSGVYFYKFNAGEFSETKRMVLIK